MGVKGNLFSVDLCDLLQPLAKFPVAATSQQKESDSDLIGNIIGDLRLSTRLSFSQFLADDAKFSHKMPLDPNIQKTDKHSSQT